MKTLKLYYEKHPLTLIIIVAFLVRMLSVLFAKGYGMHDDHFLIIETSRSWASGWDFQGWLNSVPQGHSFTYPLLMFFLFKGLAFLGIESLDIQMYFVRLIHALFSLLTIYFSHKIVFSITNDKKPANITAWILSLLWCMPWLSVRNLVEIVCMPLLVWSTWLYIRNKKPRVKDVILSGAVMGLAVAFRFQVLFFIGGFGLAMLIYKQWKNAVIWSLAVVVVFSITQISDIFIWHKPFAEMQEYFAYNLTHSGQYPQGGFFKYFGVLLGVLVPPVSVLLMFGFFYGYKQLFLFLPSFCFLFFHSIFPNKQERFIFPIIPFIILLGIIGCNAFYTKSFNPKWRKTVRICIIISIVINTVMLIPVTFHYSKRSRVETMAYMYKYRPNVKTFVYEDTPHRDWEHLPRTYAVQDCKQLNYISDTIDISQWNINGEPAFVVFAQETDLDKRVNNMQQYFPHLTYETTIKPSFLDALMTKINRHNHNYTYIIYRNTDVIK